MPKHLPPDFVPPYDAFEADFPPAIQEIATVMIGVEERGGDAAPVIAELERLLALPTGPEKIERGRHRDIPGATTTIAMVYWQDHGRFAAWQNDPMVKAWFHDPAGLTGPIGRWVETVFVPTNALDTLLAYTGDRSGLAHFARDIVLTPFHGYWGGTRDRIRVSEHSELHNPEGPLLGRPNQIDPIGRVYAVTLPENICFSRGGPDWSDASPDEKTLFLDDVHPALERGADYLRAEPAGASCYACYLMTAIDADGREREQTMMNAYFVSLADIERWTRSHPTHIEIFGKFMTMVKRLGRMPDVHLYHEVSVIPAGKVSAVYVNCDLRTGLLRYGHATELTVA